MRCGAAFNSHICWAVFLLAICCTIIPPSPGEPRKHATLCPPSVVHHRHHLGANEGAPLGVNCAEGAVQGRAITSGDCWMVSFPVPERSQSSCDSLQSGMMENARFLTASANGGA